MPSQFANRVNRIEIVHEHKPADDGIQLLLKLQDYWIAFEKFHIADPLLLSTGYRPFDCGRWMLCAHYLPLWPAQLGSHTGHVSGSTPDRQHPPAAPDPSP